MEPSHKIEQQSVIKPPLHSYYEGLGSEFVEFDGVLLPKFFDDVVVEVDLLERGEALVDFSEHGILKMTGDESVGLLHRISTNDFSHFKTGELLQTSLLTEKGRVVDSIIVLHRGADLLLFMSRGAIQRVQQWIEKFIIMEDVKISQEREKKVFFIGFSSKNGVVAQYPGYVGSATYFGQDAWFFLFRSPDEAISFLNSTTLKLVGFDAFEYFRITRGIPEYGKEMISDFNPLELNLWEQVSSTKGCYIGQEVIARLETYKKIQRSLCTIHWNSLSLAVVGNRLMSGESEVGRITSMCPDQRNSDRSLGLALVKQDHAIQGRELSLETGRGIVSIEKVHNKHGMPEPAGGVH